MNLKKVKASLREDQILFHPDEAQRLFHEAGVLFQGQIKKDFEQLIAFNRAITAERRGYLEEELAEIEIKLKGIDAELDDLDKQCFEGLSFLKETGVFIKYKTLSNEILTLRAEIYLLEYKREPLERLRTLDHDIGVLQEECRDLEEKIQADVKQQKLEQDSVFSSIRFFFKEIVEEVIDCRASLSVTINKRGHLEFNAHILDAAGQATSADLGYTYRRLLCMAFDLAILRAYSNDRFPRFVYHDGVFESLDNRKKENLLAVIRRYASFGLQSIVTLIDSDLPERTAEDLPVFTTNEIVVTLHDEDERGRLFKMKTW
ncbi:DUF2326 domain-containing protein [Xylella taiwanensis]|nr:DUF2326 domain-containing protein [Xylella taiwanensis]MCD8455595.1 DUF2326 domain-containing protein [Xylella taiwanensis]MCD8469864.1 DUF2326 domain-containing protein [Xylella taiwanensis]UFN01395.1 DUF2326 domain-containing protein [Xylella taiwanensis]UFN11469.1 DUF2326 domain-containing protein [Xylella taiwanensis]UFN20549.1 DUF2326 domain-containing protein [Xylella taiwanensis]